MVAWSQPREASLLPSLLFWFQGEFWGLSRALSLLRSVRTSIGIVVIMNSLFLVPFLFLCYISKSIHYCNQGYMVEKKFAFIK